MKTEIMEHLEEWSRLITELSYKEIMLYKMKDEFQVRSDIIIEDTDFKAIYGKNNAEIRKKHVKHELSDMYDNIKELEISIDWIIRRISFLKQLIHSKTVIMEVKE